MRVDDLDFGHDFSDRVEVGASSGYRIVIEPECFQVWKRHQYIRNIVWVVNFIAKETYLLGCVGERWQLLD